MTPDETVQEALRAGAVVRGEDASPEGRQILAAAVERYRNAVGAIAAHYSRHDRTLLADLREYGYIGLLKGLALIQDMPGVTPYTYLHYHIKREVRNAARDFPADIRVPWPAYEAAMDRACGKPIRPYQKGKRVEESTACSASVALRPKAGALALSLVSRDAPAGHRKPIAGSRRGNDGDAKQPSSGHRVPRISADTPKGSDDPLEVVATEEERAILRERIARLPKPLRELMRLRWLSGDDRPTTGELKKRFQCSQQTIYNRENKALKMIGAGALVQQRAESRRKESE